MTDDELLSRLEGAYSTVFERSLARTAAARLRELIAPEQERQRKRGAYWLTEEGRAELRKFFDDPNDSSAVYPLLTALEAAERERDALRELLTWARWHVAADPPDGNGLLERIDAALAPERGKDDAAV